MKPILLLLLPLLAQVAPCGLQEDLDAVVALRGSITLNGHYRLDKPLKVKGLPDDNASFAILGNSYIEGTFDGPILDMTDCKQGRIEGVTFRNHIGSGVRFASTASAGRWKFTGCRFECPGIGLLLTAEGGSDISCVTVDTCDFQGCSKGFKVVGPNALNVLGSNVTGSSCQTFVDLTQGGSGSVFTGGGASKCAVAYDVNPGYEFTAYAVTLEDDGIGLRLGSGTGSSVVFGVTDSRGTPILVQSATNGGNLIVDAGKCSGKIVTTGTTGYLGLSRKAALLKVTKPSDSTLMVQKSNVGFIPAK